MDVGDLIGRGRTAEVYAFGEGCVVKLLLPGFDPGALTVEAAKAQAAHDAGVAAPAAHGPITIDGRAGYVFDRADGTLMLDEIISHMWQYRRHADHMAVIHAGIHMRRSDGLPDVKDRLADRIDRVAELDSSLRRAAKDRLLKLESGDRVLHGDFHPGNVVLGERGPVVIDWIDAARGTPAADVARSLWLLSPAVIDPGTPHRRLLSALISVSRGRYLRRYVSATGLDPTAVRPWRLPVLAGRLDEGIEYEQRPLLEEIRRLVED